MNYTNYYIENFYRAISVNKNLAIEKKMLRKPDKMYTKKNKMNFLPNWRLIILVMESFY